ncbi:putative leucine-rich repeat receptor kinase [Micractinium conductrix]|uniref:Leucine-rich repeat receptor kinase n=1 Tax=Micractinium conductrix TaxID=554055 RepID=A0A2P6V4L8_9CHLO|nr:putative leucine-rich repeat receptor kinase [Micractinium conductrix]|eukprot:PSC69024.1 putative leucine-rich repeat receptor kinase [Micractinium conductrix]
MSTPAQAPTQGPVPSSGGLGLTFTAARLEEVYLVYTSEKNRGLTLRLHFMLIAAWAVGALKTVTQTVYAVQHGEPKVLPQYAFLLMAQLVNLSYQAYAMRRLRSLERKEQLLQEQTKAWLHILLDIAVMVCVMLSDPSLPHSPAPLPTLIVTSFLAVLDMIRLDTMLRLSAIKWLCFLFQETDHLMRAPGHSLSKLGLDVASALAFGTLLPFVFAVVSEASQRVAFLQDCKRPLSDLGPFWSAVHAVARRFQRQPPEEAEEAHVD